MPFYDLKCVCGEEFNVKASMKEREEKIVVCPKCGMNELSTVYKNINVLRSLGEKAVADCPKYDKCGGGGCCGR